MTISKHEVTARVYHAGGYVDLPVEDGTVAMDLGWAPFIRGFLTVPYADAVAALDPRQSPPPRIYVTATQTFGVSKTAAEISAERAGYTAADMSDVYLGMTAEMVGELYFKSWNLEGVEGSSSRSFNLTLRGVSVDHATHTARLEVSSDEALLEDYALVQMYPWVLQSQSVRTICSMVLDHLGLSLSSGTADGTIEDVSASWEPGQTAWDFLTPLVQAAGLRLWSDENRLWHLGLAEALPTGHTYLASDLNLTAADSTISRNSEWFDGVVIRYEWDDILGDRQVKYDVASVHNPSKVYSITYEAKYPGPGAASHVLKRKMMLGETIPVESVASYEVSPGNTFTLDLAGQATRNGLIQAVEWSWPDNTMQITTKDIELDTPVSI